ncbi:MAG: mechanosensitive ion channel family protein [Proteobacteria bacterium]|nr:mechanosensitive ion channel family protein [Pseudomonadota bacterium]
MSGSSWRDFLDLVLSVWNQGFLSFDVASVIISLGILAGFLILRGLFTTIVIHQIRYWSKKTKTPWDDRIIDALAPPVRFIPVVMGVFFATQYLAAEGFLLEFFSNLNRSLVTYTLFWGLLRLVKPIGAVLETSTRYLTAAMQDWFVKALRAAVILLGGATIVEIWGIEVLPLIAGLGLFGVAVALGAQDMFKNLIAGLFVIGERRFHKGDWIRVDGVVEGTVEQIGFLTTLVRRFDKAPVYVPNAHLSDNAVTNFSKMTHRRIKWLIGIEYSATREQLQQIRDDIEAHISNNEDFAMPDDVATFVRIDRFSDSSIDILLYCFTVTTDWGEWLEIKESLVLTIKDIVESTGTGFAFPSRSLYVESLPDAPKVFPLNEGEGIDEK